MKTRSIRSFAILCTLASLAGACDSEPVMEPAAEEAEEATARPEAATALATDARPAAELPGFDLSITLSGDDVALDWADMGAEQYEVWSSTYPYFEPGDFSSFVVETASETSALLVGANGDFSSSRRYYRIQTVGETPVVSTTVGRHRLTFHNGFNKVPLSLETDLVDATDLHELAGPPSTGSHQWDAVAQAYQSWDPLGGEDPFVLDQGGSPVSSLYLPEGETVQRTIAGYVPVPSPLGVALADGDNLVFVPLDFPETSARALLAAIPGAVDIGIWDAEAQQLNLVSALEPEADLDVEPGVDLHVFMGGAGDWPIEREAVSGDCYESNGNAYCDDGAVTECVCDTDGYCCSNTWDSLCAGEVESLGCDACCDSTPGVSGCGNSVIEECVCAVDSYCCNNQWDSICVNEVESLGCSNVCSD